MQRPKRWIIAESSPAAADLAGRLKTSPLIAQILLNRGLAEPLECQNFLSPMLRHLHDPGLLANLPQAAQRIAAAIERGEKIVIYGDYDVDGITATAILWHAITVLGGQVQCYIPHRIEEGYGMNAQAVGQLCQSGAKLIVSVDCGITAIEEARLAAEAGVDLIITDHHEWMHNDADLSPRLPQCLAVVHPRLAGASGAYPNPYLCGAGVAFKLAWGIGQAANGAARVSQPFKQFLMEATGLAALGTIADVVPLKGENRVLAQAGLRGLPQSQLAGIKALIESARLTRKPLDAYDVGFLLAPRLNACGRMGHAREALELLTTADAARAAEIAAYLEQQNRQRQALERQIFEQAMAQCEELGYRLEDPDCRGIVLASEGWHAGVIGIVASRVVGRTGRPTIMIALDGASGQGSGRSVPGFHLATALQACQAHLEGCGGHEMAAGLSLQADQLDAFRAAFCGYARQHVRPEMLQPELRIDCVAQLSQVTLPLVQDLERLGPFGQGNPRPLLCCQKVELHSAPRRVGRNGEHLQLWVRQDGPGMKCIAFNAGSLFEKLRPGVKVDLAVEPSINEFNGRISVELQVRDLRF